jgi:Terminase large subunit, T4likevirus-type, N-terminal
MTTVISGTERWLADDTRRTSAGIIEPRSAKTSAKTSITQSGTRNIKLGYEPFAKQQEFHASPAKYRLFGGAAGPGKSKALLMEAILQAHESPGANTLLLRRTFPELEQSLLLYFRRDVPRELYKNFNESKHVVEWLNHSTTRFGYCQNESDVYQYQGAEFLFIGIDELTLFTLRQWQFLTSRNRCAVPGSFPCMAGATNPGNIGHAWVKALWIDQRAASGMENPDAYDPTDYDFIPARVSDNPIYAGDEQYLKTLRALPTHLRRAFLDGDWDVFAGQYFDKFDYSRHVARAEQIEWKQWWPRWISIDWGFEHPSAAYWHADVPRMSNTEIVGAQHAVPGATLPRIGNLNDLAGEMPELNGMASPSTVAGHSGAVPLRQKHQSARRIVTYREYVTHRTAPRELARQIVERSLRSGCDSEAGHGFALSAEGEFYPLRKGQQQIPRTASRAAQRRTENENARDFARDDSAGERHADRERIDAIYLSPDAFARRTDEASIADQMGDVFVAAGFPRPVPADNDRVGGWMLMYQMLEAGEWLLTDNCVELVRTLPNLVRDPARIEDIEKMDGDDSADAARYGLKSRYGARHGIGSERRMPLAVRLAERVTSADPTVRAIQARKAQIEESRRSQPVSFLYRRR